MRDDFSEDAKRALAQRVANRCSHPECGAVTSGPQTDESKAVNVGVAAHITGASLGGPRYDASLSPAERSHAGNGIWLCQTHAKLVDNDVERYTADTLRTWKLDAETRADLEVGRPQGRGNERDVQTRANLLIPPLESLIGEGNRIYLRIIGDPRQLDLLRMYQVRIEEWRERVGNFCSRELPRSGAMTLALPKTGKLGVGPIGYEVTRLEAAIEGLREIVRDIETYVRRSTPT